MKIAAFIGLLFFALSIVVVFSIARRVPRSPRQLNPRSTILLMGAFVAILWFIRRWLDSIPWLPRHP